MSEYVNEDKSIIIKNETDSDFNVGVGIVFRKSGIYEISINDKTTTVTKVLERKIGQWIDGKCNRCGTHAPYWAMATTYYCSEYCPNCGARMEDKE